MRKDTSIDRYLERAVALLLLVILFCSTSVSVEAFELDAELDWSRRVELGTPVRGVVEQVMVQPGQQVKQGEILLKLDQRGFKYRIAGFKAQLKHLKAELEEAQREQDRALELYDRTVLSDHELQVAKNKFVSARANYQKGQVDLAQAELDLEYSAVRAPFDAVIIARQAEIGQIVVPDLKPMVLFIVADSKHMIAKARFGAKQLTKVDVDKKARVQVRDMNFEGRVIGITRSSNADDQPGERNLLLNVEFPVRNQKLYSGQAATVKIP